MQASLRSPTKVTLARQDTALVACCGALYVFGGCLRDSMEGRDRVDSQDLIMFKPNLSKSVSSVSCSLVRTGAPECRLCQFVNLHCTCIDSTLAEVLFILPIIAATLH